MPFHHSTSLYKQSSTNYAQAALRFASAHTPLGSSNMGVGRLSAIKPWTPNLPDPEAIDKVLEDSRDRVKRERRRKGKNYSLDDYVAEVARSQAGNCGEKSILVCYFLSQQPDPLIYYRVSLWPNDYSFVVMDQKPNIKEGLFPCNFKDWDENAVVIDPWLCICGPARHYPDLWRMKLDTMAAVGIELSNGYGSEGRNWLKANSDYWQKVPDVNKKYVTGRTPRPKSGKIECQTM